MAARSPTTPLSTGKGPVGDPAARTSWSSAAGALSIAAAAPALVAAGVLVVGAAAQTLIYAVQRWRWRHVPTARGGSHWLLGSMPAVVKAGGSHLALERWCREHKNQPFKVLLIGRVIVVLPHPDHARQVLMRCTNRMQLINPSFILQRGVQRALDESMVLQARDGLWRTLRTAWQPAFAPASLERYHRLMVQTAEELGHVLARLAAAAATTTDTSAVPPAAASEAANGAAAAASTTVNGEGAQATGGGDGFIDVHALFNCVTLQVVGTTGYGVQFNSLATVDHVLQHSAEQAGRSSKAPPAPLSNKAAPAPAGAAAPGGQDGATLSNATRDFFKYSSFQSSTRWSMVYVALPVLGPLTALLANLFPDSRFRRVLEARAQLLATTLGLVSDWRAHHPEQPPPGSAAAAAAQQQAPQGRRAGGLAGVEPGSFLGLLLDARSKAPVAQPHASRGFGTDAAKERPAAAAEGGARLSDLVIVSQANTFILAGTETTANTLAYAVYLLAQNPKAEARLVQELLSAPESALLTGGQGDAEELPYTSAVINEALRLYPPAHAVTREVGTLDKPTGITVAGIDLPYRMTVMVPIWAMHRDPALWPRAEEFLPERWLPEGAEELGARNPNAFIPFGVGPRMCPGWRFALQEARVVLAHVYRHFTFDLAPGQVPLKLSPGITLTPTNGVWARVRPREATKAAAVP